MLKLFDQIVNLLILVAQRVPIVYYLERFRRLLLHNTIKGATVHTRSHFLALIDHGFEHFEVLAGLGVLPDAPQTAFALLLRQEQACALLAHRLQDS